jgi:uncharacterized protein
METLIRHGQTVNKMYESFSRGDVLYIISLLHPDVIWEVMGEPDIPYGGIYHGQDDVKLFFLKLKDTANFNEMIPEYILESGNLVIAVGYAKGMAIKTRKLFSTSWSMIFDFNEDGKIVHFRDCYDTLTLSRAFTK